jgi:hypothetical protein
MPHVILLGDSIFDNGVYTCGGPDVVTQVRQLLPTGWNASLRAVDGATTANIPEQLHKLPTDATHLVLSVGGNNALSRAPELGISLFGLPGAASSHSLRSLVDISDEFGDQYRSTIEACLRAGLPLAVCTIYNGCFPDAAYQRIAKLGLGLFNDIILQVAIEKGLPIIDLRAICTNAEDYANPIEPSSIGGEKIARVIVALVTRADDGVHGTKVLGRPHEAKAAR